MKRAMNNKNEANEQTNNKKKTHDNDDDTQREIAEIYYDNKRASKFEYTRFTLLLLSLFFLYFSIESKDRRLFGCARTY